MPSECTDTHIRLDLSAVPAVYSVDDLRERAEQVVQEVQDLLQLEDLLIHSRVRYRLSQEVDVKAGMFKHVILLDLVPKRAVQLDLFTGALDRETLVAAMTKESQALLEAFRAAPQRCDRARVQFAMRNAMAVSGCEPSRLPPFDAAWGAFLKGRRRSFNGAVSGFPWQLQLEHVGFDWDCTPTRIRARIVRERDGFALRLLDSRRTANPCNQRVKMDFPSGVEDAVELDRATHTGEPRCLIVRFGRVPGNQEPSRADFVRFGTGGAE